MYDKKTGLIRKLKLSANGKPRGRPRLISATGCLALVLYWFRTRGSVARATSVAFGLTSTQMYMWLKFSRKILLSVLQNHPLAAVTTPTESEITEYMAVIAKNFPVLEQHRV